LNWEEEQERLTLEARLLASSPEAVFDELKKLSAKTRAHPFWNNSGDKYEISLVSRNERLINLGLAAYGTNQEVLKALYKHGLEPAKDVSDTSYREGLRIGCLSNSTAPAAHFSFQFPIEIIGSEEIRRIVNEASSSEVAALIQNPKVSDNLLEALYKHQGVFAGTLEERWQQLIYVSASNARLVTEYEYEDSPNMGHYGIHKSIFGLLETAPVNYQWLRTLYHLLDHLNFRQVHRAEHIDQVLGRWAQLPTSKEKNSLEEGYFTTRNIRDEFRCLIATLYSHGFVNKKTVLHGDRDADDLALRCAYYAAADLTARDMEAGYKKDGDVFTFAATLNSRVHQRRELRQLMEDQYLGGGMAQRWLKYDEQLRKEWPNSVPPISAELPIETAPETPDAVAVQSSITELQKRLTTLARRVSELRQLVIGAAIYPGSSDLFPVQVARLGFFLSTTREGKMRYACRKGAIVGYANALHTDCG
jgi:hypothetical protein